MTHWTQRVTLTSKRPEDAEAAAVIQGVLRHILGEMVTPEVDRAIDEAAIAETIRETSADMDAQGMRALNITREPQP